MDRGLYLSAMSAKHAMFAQTVSTNNLANAQTTGFRAAWAQQEPARVPHLGFPTRTFALIGSQGTDFRAGAYQTTGNSMDVAVQGEGWFAVQDKNGKEAYTRNGQFRLNTNGQLETSRGELVLGSGGVISLPPSQAVEIGDDGTISVQGQGQGPSTMSSLDRLKLVNPALNTLVRGEDGLFRSKTGSSIDADANVHVKSGMIEGSNVSPVQELLHVLECARYFETNIKFMQHLQKNDEAGAHVLQINS